VKLTLTDPPGRSTRKARGFGAEIRELRAMGYSFQSIRQALAQAGVKVSKSTVQREAARLAARQISRLAATPMAAIAATPELAATHPSLVPPPPPAPALPTHSRARDPPASLPQATEPSGKDFAAAYFSTRIDHPLIRERTTP
jgi:hypothetical protein